MRKPYLIFWFLFALGLALRIPLLNYSFFGDEWFSIVRDSQRLITESEDRFRPLFFTILYLWKQLGFSSEAGLRSLVLIFGALQLPLAYLIGKRLRDETFGLHFTALIALSPILIEFSQELRMYSLITTIGMLQVWLFLKLQKDRSLAVWIAFILTALAGIYTHLFYWLFLPGMALSFWRVRREIPFGKSIIAMAAVVLLYLPNIPNLLAFVARRGGEYPMHFPSAVPKLFAAFTVGFNYFSLPEQGADRAIGSSILVDNLPLLIPALLVGLLVLWGFLRLRRRPHFHSRVWLYDELFTIPVLLAAIASLVTGKYFLQPKYLIFCVPLFLALILESVYVLPKKWLRQIAAGLGMLLFLIAIHHYWHPRDYGRKENWKAAAEYLRKNLNDRSALITLYGLPLLEYYAPKIAEQAHRLTPPKITLSPGNPATAKIWRELPPASTYYYLHWDTRQNALDPGNHFVPTMTNLMVTTRVDTLNPRLRLYTWKVPVN